MIATRLVGAIAVLLILRAAVAAQNAQSPPARSQSRPVVGQWELRGVVIADESRLALLENRSSGRQQLLRVGDVLGDGVSLSTIGADRVVLDAEGTAVTLRLGHGGPPRVSRPSSAPGPSLGSRSVVPFRSRSFIERWRRR